ncbi:MAG: SCO6745 family protein [Microthrixaceae bacterium]
MDALTAADRTAAAVSTIGSHFMLDGSTYKRGAELGFQGLDFYVTGRGGVLGDVDADVVSAAFTFFEPGGIRTLWDQGRAVMPPAQAATEFAACCATWAEAHVPDDLDAARLAELAGKVVAGARPACASVFAGWRALAVPSSPKAAAVRHLNTLRELRNGLHGAAIISNGLTPLQALSIKSPHMVALFGWSEPADADGLLPAWEAAEAQTTASIAHAYEALDDTERDELGALAVALHEATNG